MRAPMPGCFLHMIKSGWCFAMAALCAALSYKNESAHELRMCSFLKTFSKKMNCLPQAVP